MSFLDIKGHSLQIKTLVDSVDMDRLSCAYLFTGPCGIGKKLLAINFAKFINCHAPVRNSVSLRQDYKPVSVRNDGGWQVSNRVDNPCDQCSSCRRIDSGHHPDVFLITGNAGDVGEGRQGEVKIEDVREIEERSYFKPYEAKYKIFIIDGSENMTQDAAFALLKTLEEPPGDTIFILISAQEKMLLPTVVSRCRRIRFNALTLGQIKEILMKDYDLDEKKAHFISYFCEGRIALALGYKDRDILKEKNDLIDDFIYKRTTFKDRNDAKHRLNLFLGWLRDLVLLKISRMELTLTEGVPDRMSSLGLRLINVDRQADLVKSKDSWTLCELEKSISFISEMLFYLEKNINVRLLTNLVRIRLK